MPTTRHLSRHQDTAGNDAIALKCKALSHPVRLQILSMLRDKVCLCGEIVDVLPLAQATVSQHLKVLKSSGFIIGETEGTRVCYMLNKIELERFKREISKL